MNKIESLNDPQGTPDNDGNKDNDMPSAQINRYLFST